MQPVRPASLATVLVVEDNPVSRRMLRVILTREGYKVVEAGDGKQALHLAHEVGPDIVLSDLVLPDIDGFDVLRQLRARAGTRTTPVVAVTGMEEDDRVRAAGFADHLLKPIDATELLECVRRTLPARRDVVPGPCGDPPRVLLVCEELADLRQQAARLRHLGLDVVTACGAAEAIAEAQNPNRIDLVIADVLMGGIDGFQLCMELRHLTARRTTPILLTSPHALVGDHAELARQVGATEVIVGGSDPVAFEHTIRRRLAIDAATVSKRPLIGFPVANHQRVVRELEQQATLRTEIARTSRVWKTLTQLLARIAEQQARPIEPSELLGELVADVLDAFGCQSGAAFAVAPDGTLELQARIGPDRLGGACAHDNAACMAHLHRVLEGGVPVVLTELGACESERPLFAGWRASAMLIVPLCLGPERLGVIVFSNMSATVPEGWLQVARAVATPIAQALVCARTVSRLVSSEQRFRGIAESTTDSLLVTDLTGVVVYANARAQELFADEGESLVGQRAARHLPFVDPQGAAHQHGTLARGERGELPVEVTVQPLGGCLGPQSFVYAVRDVSARLQLVQFAHLANHDSLTGLFNRRRFDEELQSKLLEARRYRTRGALVVVDLDRFKAINDSHGHLVGDAVLREVGRVLRDATRQTDVAARLGGDEFVALLPHADREGALVCARKILARLASAVVMAGDQVLQLGGSIGVSCYPEDGMDPTMLFAAADVALYAAKQAGRHRVFTSRGDASGLVGAPDDAQDSTRHLLAQHELLRDLAVEAVHAARTSGTEGVGPVRRALAALGDALEAHSRAEEMVIEAALLSRLAGDGERVTAMLAAHKQEHEELRARVTLLGRSSRTGEALVDEVVALVATVEQHMELEEVDFLNAHLVRD